MIALLRFRTRRLAALALVSAAALEGCSSGAQPPVPLAAHASLAPVSFSIAWKSSTSSARRPAYVSPSAQSVVIRINGDPSLTAFANKGSSGISSLALQAPVGTDTFLVSLYDATQSSGTSPSGALVGQVTVVQTIVAGKLNAVTAVVNGVVKSATIDALPGQAVLETTSSGYAIVGQHSATFAVTPRDADGNAIVPPGVTPAITLKSDAGNPYFAVLPATDPSQFNVVVTSQAPPGYSGSFTASATDAQNTTVTASMSVAQRGEVYVAYRSGRVLAFDDAGNALALPSNAFAGLQQPGSLAYDASERTLFVADAGSGTIQAFTLDGAPQSGFTAPALPGVTAIAWSSRVYQDQILGVSASRAIIASAFTGGATGDTATTSPFVVTAGSGAAFVPGSSSQSAMYLISNTSAGELDAYTLYGARAIFPPTYIALAPVSGTPGALAPTPDGLSVFVSGTASGTGELWRVPVASGAPPAIAVADGQAPAGIGYDPVTGRLFVAESAAGTVTARLTDLTLDPTTVLTAPPSAGVSNPQGVAIAY